MNPITNEQIAYNRMMAAERALDEASQKLTDATFRRNRARKEFKAAQQLWLAEADKTRKVVAS